MRDTTVTECKAIFVDNEATNPQTPGDYEANADYTFVIQPGGPVQFSCSCFDTEDPQPPGIWLDTMFIYDGVVAPGNLLWVGAGNVGPPPLTAASGTMIVKFKSDGSVQRNGWVCRWRTIIPPPEPPRLVVNPAPSCSTTVLNIGLTKRVHCDSIYASAFNLTGPGNPIVTNVQGLGCPTPDDSTNAIQVTIAPPGLAENCTYNIDYTFNILDECDSMWTFFVDTTFDIIDCPLPIVMTSTSPNDTICPGSCVDLTASSTSSSCLPLTWGWNQGLGSGTGPKNVCPTTTTTYVVNVNTGGPSFFDSITIVVVDPQIIPDTITVCQSDPAFPMNATPTGGQWIGPGMLIGTPGWFDPDTAGGGNHWVYYGIGTGCRDSVLMEVTPIDAGLDEAACPGGAPFPLSGFGPPGGYWTGPFVDSAGMFNPSTPGVYIDTFWVNGCMDIKTVTVGGLVGNHPIDSVCQDIDPYILPLNGNPPGGIWGGNTVCLVDSITGLFDPDLGGGGLKTLWYTLSNGCADTLYVFVKAMDPGPNRSMCPTQGLVSLNPGSSGGVWTSDIPGSLNPATDPALYDPSIGGHGTNDYLKYTMPNGCEDSIRLFIRITDIIDKIKYFCIDDDSVNLTEPIPDGGIMIKSPCCSGSWTTPAPGAIKYFSAPLYDHYFYPGAAGPGVHWMKWTKNTCYDTVPFIVYPNLDIRDTTVCSIANAWILGNMPDSTTWFGPGVNPVTGLFDPALAGTGTHAVGYTTPAGCQDTAMILVYPFQAASINGLISPYCYKDTNYAFNYTPGAANIWFGPGTDTSTMTFNPSYAGQGYDTIIVSFGIAECEAIDTMIIQVHPQLTTTHTTTADTICGDGLSIISIIANGGDPNAPYQYTWNNGLPPSDKNSVSPDSTTTYIIRTDDGCSDPAYDTVTIFIFPEFFATFSTSDTVCDGLNGWVHANVTPPDSYNYGWGSGYPNQDSVHAAAGSSFNVKITNTTTGCHIDTSLTIPVYSSIKALFSANPEDDCIPYDQRQVRFIDLSENALTGSWLIDGQVIPYTLGFNPTKAFDVPGNHTIQLIVFNEGNCSDTFNLDICIQEDTTVFVPDAFSPNGDGVNDILYARAGGYKEMQFRVFNRFGQMVFETTDSKVGWDGRINGKDAPQGVYVYYVTSLTVDNVPIYKQGDVTLVR